MQRIWRTIGRYVQHVRHRLNPPAVFVVDGGPALAVPEVPLDPKRADRILASLADEQLIFPSIVHEALPASYANLRRTHTDRYLDSIADPAVLGAVFGIELAPDEVDPVLESSRRAVGGTIQATRLAVKDRKVAIHLGGGLHHAAPDRGMGFCVFNDIAVAIQRLRARGFQAPALVVDLDLHDGNGTRAAFADDESVHTFSIHNTPWDDSPAVASTAIALGSDVEDSQYLDTIASHLPGIVQSLGPDLVVYLAGTDPAFDDEIGDWRISPEGMLARDQLVVNTLRQRVPSAALAIVLGGGYGTSAWRYSARFIHWLMTGRAREPTDPGDALLKRAARLGRALRDQPLDDQAPNDDWGLSASDLPGLAATSPDTRVLGHYTRHGVELLLERTGILGELRQRGFPNPSVNLSAPRGGTPTIQVFTDEEYSRLLMELRVTRNSTVLPGREVLYVDWLLLQDPTRGFTEARPRLPGQDHPGLGILGQVAGLLVAMTKALDLVGIVFVPANYYMAVLGRHHLRFLDPVDQGRFESLLGTLSGLSLAEGSRALAEGRVRDIRSGAAYQWDPKPMVVPQGRAMRALVETDAYLAALREARDTHRFELAGSPAGA